ncbi:MAG TPA: Na-translocating system protein MpsC family protein [Solirubrobacteraceae bacterium]|nr:Na-translocating system protein MpsC family protein [Solirubrobacteraceae bacterium]
MAESASYGDATTPGPGPTDGSDSAGAPERRSLSEISNALVQVYKDQFGRGPTKVRTHYAGPDTLVCLLEQTFTPAELNLQAMDEHQRLRDIRLFFQYAERSRFTEPVERITGRRVKAFVSGIDTHTDLACELFVLEADTRRENGDSSS